MNVLRTIMCCGGIVLVLAIASHGGSGDASAGVHSGTSAPPPIGPNAVLGLSGYGPIRLNDPLPAIRRRTSTRIVADAPSSCATFGIPSIRGVTGILVGNRVRTIEIHRNMGTPAVKTRDGLSLKSKPAVAQSLYGKPDQSQKAKYFPNGFDLHWKLGKYAGKTVWLRVITSSTRRIEIIEVGYKPQIELVEGCL